MAWRSGSLSAVSTSAEIGRSGLTLGRGSITVPGAAGLPFGAAQFRIDGSLVEAEGADGPASLEIQGLWFTGTSGFRISELRYTTNAGEELAFLQLSFSGELHLPAPFREAATYGDFLVDNSGRVRYDADAGRGDFDFSHRGVEGHFSRPRFDSTDGFRLDQPELRLSDAMGGGSIRIDAAALTPQGRFDLYGFQTAPVDFWGLGISFGKIGFTEKGFTGEDGYARILQKGSLGSLTGFAVKSFGITYDGVLERSSFELPSDYIELSDTLALENAGLTAAPSAPGSPFVLALNGTLALPTSLGEASRVRVLRLPVDLTRQQFLWEQLVSAPVVFEQSGLQFDLVFRGVNEAGAYLFQGHAKVVEKSLLARWPSTAPSGYLVTEFTLGADGNLAAVFLVPGHVSPFTARYDGGWLLGR